MNYQNKYIKYKNKYIDLKNLIKQKGGNDLIIQTIWTSIEEFSQCQYHDETKKNQLTTNIKKCIIPDSNAYLIQVKGDGNCMLYAVSSYLFLYIQNINLQTIDENFSNSLNKCYEADFIKTSNLLLDNIMGYSESIKRLVSDNFSEISNIILKKKIEMLGFTNKDEAREILDFKVNLSDENNNYPLAQLGQILSTVLECVIINILPGDECKFYGIYPTKIYEDLPIVQILNNVENGTWKVVFLLNPSERHYYSLIPYTGIKDIPIKDLSIEYLKNIFNRVEWL